MRRIEEPEQPAERVVARRAVLQFQEPAQELQLRSGEFRHVGAVFGAAQHSAQRDQQHFQQVVACRVAGARVPQILETGFEAFHRRPLRVSSAGVESIRAEPGEPEHGLVKLIRNAIPCHGSALD